ncbi:Signal peptide peptidase-like 3 [Acipenser ruthenus]|uniref:Signal peptide peptidase-like 3 n=1 Tax=Acipenser ruthenus TaxID=7906 RepID=A0A444UYR8_ACIRT|nr:Signal peptide peptidase-like 3 [Acipenser ruthenus]
MIAFVRLPSLKVSCLLLSGLLIYDVFWMNAIHRAQTAIKPVPLHELLYEGRVVSQPF